MRPTFRFLFSHPAHFVSLGFGSGLAPFAPGTFGTLLGWLLFPLIYFPFAGLPFGEYVFVCLLVLFFVIGIPLTDKSGKALGVPDHGAIVWDEMVAIWLVLALTPATFWWQLVAVVLFRFFDIVKPPPVRWADRAFKGGFGVMLDDIIAAAYALLVLAVLIFILQNP